MDFGFDFVEIGGLGASGGSLKTVTFPKQVEGLTLKHHGGF
jgi:hypothetical protein